MESKNLGYSLKSIPILSKASYLKSLMDKVDNFKKNNPLESTFFSTTL